jgi:hypothetical protein
VLDLPDEVLAFDRIGFRRLPVDQRIDLRIASGIIARRSARVILIERLSGSSTALPERLIAPVKFLRIGLRFASATVSAC